MELIIFQKWRIPTNDLAAAADSCSAIGCGKWNQPTRFSQPSDMAGTRYQASCPDSIAWIMLKPLDRDRIPGDRSILKLEQACRRRDTWPHTFAEADRQGSVQTTSEAGQHISALPKFHGEWNCLIKPKVP